jgi:hypothetical protein
MEQEAADELVDGKLQGLFAVAVGGVALNGKKLTHPTLRN